MKNYEKYADEIKGYKDLNFCKAFVFPYILKSDSCGDIGCHKCRMLQMMWLLEDYEEPKEPEVDWSKVKVDTPILVKDSKNGMWMRSHFAKYENETVYAWSDGCTSWTLYDHTYVTPWNYAKLVESEEE